MVNGRAPGGVGGDTWAVMVWAEAGDRSLLLTMGKMEFKNFPSH